MLIFNYQIPTSRFKVLKYFKRDRDYLYTVLFLPPQPAFTDICHKAYELLIYLECLFGHCY